MILEQQEEVENYRKFARKFTEDEVSQIHNLIGVLLTGSTARGDARLAPRGFAIDILIVIEDGSKLDLTDKFGENIVTEIPYHVIQREGTYINIELRSIGELRNIRQSREDVIFAKSESMVLMDPSGILKEWKRTAFNITENDIKIRALSQRFRFNYLVNYYRQEKWEYRDAKTQIAQNYNEATECYCGFLHCINGFFIPRRDWLVYLTYDYALKPENHDEIMGTLYGVGENPTLENRWKRLLELKKWIDQYCKKMEWV